MSIDGSRVMPQGDSGRKVLPPPGSVPLAILFSEAAHPSMRKACRAHCHDLLDQLKPHSARASSSLLSMAAPAKPTGDSPHPKAIRPITRSVVVGHFYRSSLAGVLRQLSAAGGLCASVVAVLVLRSSNVSLGGGRKGQGAWGASPGSSSRFLYCLLSRLNSL